MAEVVLDGVGAQRHAHQHGTDDSERRRGGHQAPRPEVDQAQGKPAVEPFPWRLAAREQRAHALADHGEGGQQGHGPDPAQHHAQAADDAEVPEAPEVGDDQRGVGDRRRQRGDERRGPGSVVRGAQRPPHLLPLPTRLEVAGQPDDEGVDPVADHDAAQERRGGVEVVNQRLGEAEGQHTRRQQPQAQQPVRAVTPEEQVDRELDQDDGQGRGQCQLVLHGVPLVASHQQVAAVLHVQVGRVLARAQHRDLPVDRRHQTGGGVRVSVLGVGSDEDGQQPARRVEEEAAREPAELVVVRLGPLVQFIDQHLGILGRVPHVDDEGVLLRPLVVEAIREPVAHLAEVPDVRVQLTVLAYEVGEGGDAPVHASYPVPANGRKPRHQLPGEALERIAVLRQERDAEGAEAADPGAGRLQVSDTGLVAGQQADEARLELELQQQRDGQRREQVGHEREGPGPA